MYLLIIITILYFLNIDVTFDVPCLVQAVTWAEDFRDYLLERIYPGNCFTLHYVVLVLC
jgi:hypothetical protein